MTAQVEDNVPPAEERAAPEGSGKRCRCLEDVTVEPMVACFVIPSVLASLATVNLNLEKACRVNLALGDPVCTALARRETSGLAAEELRVQTLVAGVSAWRSVAHSCVPALLVLFAGSWSDRRGGLLRPFLLLPPLGELLSSCGLLLCTYFFLEWPVEVAGVVESLLPSLFGGSMLFYLGVYGYVGAATAEARRTFRVGVVNVFTYLAIPVGTSLSGVLLREAGFYGVFGATSALYVLGVLYGYLRIREPRRPPVAGGKGFLRDFFDVRHVLETVRVVTKKREGSRRLRIVAVMFLAVVVAGPLYGELAVFYLFARFRFNWDEVDYSAFATYCVAVNLVGMSLVTVVMSRVLKWDDCLIGALSCASKVFGSLCFAFCDSVPLFYAAAAIDMLSGGGSIVLRSAASKLVPVEELGKVNSLFGLCEAVAPLLYGPLYSWIYSMTLASMPGACFLAGFALTLPAVALFLFLYVQGRRKGKEHPPPPPPSDGSYVNRALQVD